MYIRAYELGAVQLGKQKQITTADVWQTYTNYVSDYAHISGEWSARCW